LHSKVKRNSLILAGIWYLFTSFIILHLYVPIYIDIQHCERNIHYLRCRSLSLTFTTKIDVRKILRLLRTLDEDVTINNTDTTANNLFLPQKHNITIL